ncbi:hypothetical protein DICA3_F09384 [Diutina catenulata]
MYATSSNPPIVVKTSKQWVLPPRPKPGRKPTSQELEAAAAAKRKPIVPKKSPLVTAMPPSKIMESLKSNIQLIDSENSQLKSNLLSLIHDYKHLKNLVLNGDYIDAAATAKFSTAHKRSFNEASSVNDLINNLNDLTYDTASNSPVSSMVPSPTSAESPVTSPAPEDTFSQFITLDDPYKPSYLDDSDDDLDLDDSPARLSRTISPSTSDFDSSHSLMSSLTRSTTQTSVGTCEVAVAKRGSRDRKFFELPKFDEEVGPHVFKFDALMSAPYPEDEYHMINDFLEEKLLDNDLKYYVDQDQILDKW